MIAGGLAILYTLATHFGIQLLQPARGALRQGVIFDLDERLHAESRDREGHDMRDASVVEMQRRFEVDTTQAWRVASVADALHASVAPERSPIQARELRWACALHEMGMMISHHDHHRHSAYVLGNVDAAGFSQSQQRRLAELVLAQRGGLRKVEPQLANTDFAAQALCLRLAIIKCHARGPVDPTALQLQLSGRQATLGFSEGWAQTHPRTLFLLNEEVEAWQRSNLLKLALKPK